MAHNHEVVGSNPSPATKSSNIAQWYCSKDSEHLRSKWEIADSIPEVGRAGENLSVDIHGGISNKAEAGLLGARSVLRALDK